MHWIIQRENACVWPVWEAELKRLALPCSVVRVIPYTRLIIPDVNPEGKVICLGNTAAHDDLSFVARTRGWSPGMWVDNLDARMWNEKLGESMLNCGATFTTLGKVAAGLQSDVFIRPVHETKAFNGGVLRLETVRGQGEEFWTRQVFPKLRADTEVLIAPVVEIEAEFRFFVVAGKPVAWSRYRRGDARNWTGEVGEEVIRFVQAMADRWGPGEAYVIDVARSRGALKVVEFNCLNSSALCGCNATAVIVALERCFGR